MSQNYLFEERPPMWWIEPAGIDPATAAWEGDVLRLGSHEVAIDDIVSYRVEEVVERDVEGLLMAGAGMLVGASIFLIGVLSFGWLERFLIGFAFLGVFAIASLSEALGVNSIRYMRLTVFTHGGRSVPFVSTDARDIGRLVDFLDSELRR